MEVEVLADAEAVARRAAEFIAAEARAAAAARERFVLGVSGGRTPWIMLRHVAGMDLPWDKLYIVQIDERVAPAGDADRNLTSLRECLKAAPLPRGRIYAMPVEAADLNAAAAQYAAQIRGIGGAPPVLDLAHLGLGDDGHTASLPPGDDVLKVTDADVAVTAPFRGHRRMTLTYPMLNRSRRILWVVTGAEKVDALRKLRAGDESIPAGRVERENAVVMADRAAVGEGA